MKIRLNKWISLLTGALLLANLNSCIKDKGYKLETDFAGLQDHVVLLNAGLGGVSASNISFPTDTTTVTIRANLTSVNPPTSPINVTIGVDAAQIATYNAAHNTAFVALPDSDYVLTTTALTIPAGQQYASTTISFYNKVDPSVSYMLPISITDASGKALSGNENTRFFNVIGNVLAGTFKWDWTRWNSGDTTSTPNAASFKGKSTTFLADDATTIEVQSGYGAQNSLNIRYVIAFTNNGGVLSNFTVNINPDDVKKSILASTGIGALSFTDATILIADGATSHFRFTYALVNSAGTPRTFIDEFYK